MKLWALERVRGYVVLYTSLQVPPYQVYIVVYTFSTKRDPIRQCVPTKGVLDRRHGAEGRRKAVMIQ